MGTTNLDFSSTIRKEGAHPKTEARGEFEREEFVKRAECQTESKAWRSQQQPKSFGLEVFSFGSRPRLIETEFGQGVTYQDEIRPGKSRRDDSIQRENLGKKESSAQKLGDAGGEGNGANKGRRGSGFSRFMNGDDSGRFQQEGKV